MDYRDVPGSFEAVPQRRLLGCGSGVVVPLDEDSPEVLVEARSPPVDPIPYLVKGAGFWHGTDFSCAL